MVLFTLLIYGLCVVEMILIINVVIVLLAICLVVAYSLFNDDLIKTKAEEARKAIDQGRHEYLDHIYSEQLHMENQNEQLG